MRHVRLALIPCVLALATGMATAPAASAAGWWPHPADASWTYSWADSGYAPTPTLEKVTVADGADAKAFTLAWTTNDLGNAPGAVDSRGVMAFSDTTAGIQNTDWTSTPPPAAFPVLCAQISSCGNSLAGTLYLTIWGSRSPVLAEPLLKGMAWSGTGGINGDVTSTTTYDGNEMVSVPAFPGPVSAAKIHTDISQAGALGDPYGSGTRTVWWVYGVGPVKVEFQHAGGSDAPVTTSVLQTTTLSPKPAPSNTNYFPLIAGRTAQYRWSNPKHLPKPSVQKTTVDAVVNGSGRIVVASVSGPIKVAASYGFTARLDGLINIWGQEQAASIAKLPGLGPRAAPKDRRRHFFTPLDLLVFGFNPVLPAYPEPGASWKSKIPSRDFTTFGVTGTTQVVGIRKVKVPAGRFDALEVQSTLTQPGFAFGTGIRTAWFAPDRGLVKLVFRHADHSTSTVELLK